MSLLFCWCVCVFCDSFLCSISLLLLSGSLSYVLNIVLYLCKGENYSDRNNDKT